MFLDRLEEVLGWGLGPSDTTNPAQELASADFRDFGRFDRVLGRWRGCDHLSLAGDPRPHPEIFFWMYKNILQGGTSSPKTRISGGKVKEDPSRISTN